jgi:hypothetical protein
MENNIDLVLRLCIAIGGIVVLTWLTQRGAKKMKITK